MVECVSPILGRCAPPASALRLALRLGRSEVQKALRLLLLLVSLQLTFGCRLKFLYSRDSLISVFGASSGKENKSSQIRDSFEFLHGHAVAWSCVDCWPLRDGDVVESGVNVNSQVFLSRSVLWFHLCLPPFGNCLLSPPPHVLQVPPPPTGDRQGAHDGSWAPEEALGWCPVHAAGGSHLCLTCGRLGGTLSLEQVGRVIAWGVMEK